MLNKRQMTENQALGRRASQVALVVKKQNKTKQKLLASAGNIKDTGLIPELGKIEVKKKMGDGRG